MESLAKGIHYNICACARKETTEGGKKTRRYGRALHDTRVLTCLTPGSRYARHPGVGHKIMANGRNDTGRKQYRKTPKKDRKKDGRGKDTKKQRHSKRTEDTEKRRKAAGSPENTKQATTQQTC